MSQSVATNTNSPLAEPSERGLLEIATTVVTKVAERTADGVEGITTAKRRIAGIGMGSHGTSAKVTGHENNVDVFLDLAVHYPKAVPTVVEEVRERVRSEVERITSYRVRTLKVKVSALLPETTPRVQ